MRWLRILGLAAVLFAGVALIGRPAFLYLMEKRQTPVVEAVLVMRGEIIQAISATSASVQPRLELVVAADRPGYVSELHVGLGQAVKEGDVLAILLDPVLEGEFSQAVIEVERARRSLERTRALSEHGLVPRVELENAEDDFRLATARQAILESRRGQLTILAPITGIVTARHTKPGEQLGTTTVGSQLRMNLPIVTISTVNDLVVRAYIDESDIPVVRSGQEARVVIEALNGKEFAGVVESVAPAPSVTAGSTTYETTITLRGRLSASLRPGLKADVRVVVARAAAVVRAPREAIFPCGRRHCAFVLNHERAELRQVETGINDSTQVAILSGLAVGENVIVGFPEKLKHGEKVIVQGRAR